MQGLSELRVVLLVTHNDAVYWEIMLSEDKSQPLKLIMLVTSPANFELVVPFRIEAGDEAWGSIPSSVKQIAYPGEQ